MVYTDTAVGKPTAVTGASAAQASAASAGAGGDAADRRNATGGWSGWADFEFRACLRSEPLARRWAKAGKGMSVRCLRSSPQDDSAPLESGGGGGGGGRRGEDEAAEGGRSTASAAGTGGSSRSVWLLVDSTDFWVSRLRVGGGAILELLVSQAFSHHPDAVGTFNRCRRRRDDDGMLERLAEGIRQLRLAYCRGLIGETREVRIKVFIVTWCHLLKVPTASECRRRRDDDGMLERLAEGVQKLRLAHCRGLISETREIRIKVHSRLVSSVEGADGVGSAKPGDEALSEADPFMRLAVASESAVPIPTVHAAQVRTDAVVSGFGCAAVMDADRHDGAVMIQAVQTGGGLVDSRAGVPADASGRAIFQRSSDCQQSCRRQKQCCVF
uniref:Rad51 domain-containing protein n=1 Tax=Macrostomum lignano TaxID=282301 RepID=A0A1I8H6S4_9PLAT